MRALGSCRILFASALLSSLLAVSKARASDHVVPRDADAYERCKATHRCPRAFSWYNLENATYSFASAMYLDGRLEESRLFADFEDWFEGSRGWEQSEDRKGHFSSFDFELLGPLDVAESDVPMQVIFNTSSLEGRVENLENGTWIWEFSGQLGLTESGTQVAVFNFDFIKVGSNCQLRAVGDRAIALLSRSSIDFGSQFEVQPGTLGGFPGGRDVAFNNINGPGSTSRVVYLYTIESRGEHMPEVQTITTSARQGQTLSGDFTLTFLGEETHPIPHDASPELVKARLERASTHVGRVQVTRSRRSDEGGYTWTIVFLTCIGDVQQLEVGRNNLNGIDANVVTSTQSDGNEIDGSMSLSFLGKKTPAIPINATSRHLSDVLFQSFQPFVATVYVQRSDQISDNELASTQPRAPCDNGLCTDGPHPGKGYTWTILLTTDQGNISPTSPTSPSATVDLTAYDMDLTVLQLTGVNATVDLFTGHRNLDHAQSFTDAERLNLTLPSVPFTLAIGGAGGSYASISQSLGDVMREEAVSQPVPYKSTSPSTLEDLLSAHMQGRGYGTNEVEDLVGGSGGAIGGISVKDILTHYPPAGVGGDGGGAVEIVAVNDITFFDTAKISVNGGNGKDAFWGGGGGSGGALVIAAGGFVDFRDGCKLEANGGEGGSSLALQGKLSQTHSDGSAGRIAVLSKSVSFAGKLPRDQLAASSMRNHRERNGMQNETDAIPIVAVPEGSIHVQADLGPSITLDRTLGAAGTNSSLKLYVVGESVSTASSIIKSSPLVRNGPTFSLLREDDPTELYQPDRVSLFLRIGDSTVGRIEDLTTGFVGLHETLNQSKSQTMIGTAVVNGELRHGSNYFHFPSHSFYKGVREDIWYKLDVFLDWTHNTYSIRLNDVEYVLDAPFQGSRVAAIGLYGFHESELWFDEVFVGHDDTAGFRCPRSKSFSTQEAVSSDLATREERMRAGEMVASRPEQTDWNAEWHGPETDYHEMTTHDSHLSRRELYQGSKAAIPFGTGGVHKYFVSEIEPEDARTGSRLGGVHMGVLLHAPSPEPEDISDSILSRAKTTAGDPDSSWRTGYEEDGSFSNGNKASTTGRVFWYGEHDNPNQTESDFLGGIMACSTTDFVHWRNEGTMVHFTNITYDGGVPRLRIDLHGGYDGEGVQTAGRRHTVEVPVEEIVAVGNWTGAPLRAERPKVLFNNETGQYVMWSEVHDDSNELGVTLVATSDFPGGPFFIHDTFLPDGNQTHDQTIIKRRDGQALLVRTYYATVDYVLPEPVMQPMWESVKRANGEVDFGLNFHRSNYTEGYDDSNDICIQRLRKEDILENIFLLPESERVPVEEWIRNAYSGEGILENYVVAEQSEPWKFQQVLGQGNPIVDSRFKHPNWTENNEWMPSSVPAVKSQPWMYNYLDSNIADNVVHPTLPDKLIGPPQVVEQRRSKYIAVSLLTPDFLNTSGVMTIYEGYVEGGESLSALLNDLNLFHFDAQETPGWYERRFFPAVCDGGELDDSWETCNNAPLQTQESTAPGQVWGLSAPFNFVTERDWSWRYHQYRWNYMDRSYAPVNFADQLVDWFTPGRGESRTTKGRAYFREYDYNCYRGPNEYDPEDPRYIPADTLFKHRLSQYFEKTENVDMSVLSAHLYDW